MQEETEAGYKHPGHRSTADTLQEPDVTCRPIRDGQ